MDSWFTTYLRPEEISIIRIEPKTDSKSIAQGPNDTLPNITRHNLAKCNIKFYFPCVIKPPKQNPLWIRWIFSRTELQIITIQQSYSSSADNDS